MGPPIKPETLQLIEADFPAADRQGVIDLLLSYGDEPHHREPDRLRRDILLLSQGKLDKVKEWLALAKRDFRDVIVSTEYTALPRSPGQ